MKNVINLILLVSCIFSLGLSTALAQSGIIRGTISDEATGEVLMFTNVIVKDQAIPIGAQTDLDGNYEISITPGTYTLEVSYVGYAINTITDVVVTKGEVTLLDFLMKEESQVLDEVVVKAERIDRTENALLALQRKAITVQDGISSQEINRYGSSNAAESMKRVTGASVVDGKYIVVRGLGDRYTSAQINGQQLPSTDPYRNSIQLDLVPANLLDNMIASKTFTPDQPGSFTGGNVNLKTKSFPDRFTLSASLSSNFNTQSSLQDNFLTSEGGQTDWLGYDDGFRDIPAILQDPSYLDTVTTSTAIRARRDKFLAELLDEGANSLNQQRIPSTKNTSFDHGASFSIGNQFSVADNPFGVLVGLNYRKNYDLYEGIDAFFELTDPEADLNINRNLMERRGTETATIGGMVNLSYKFGGSNKISFISLYNHIGTNDNRIFQGDFPAIISGNGQFETRAIRFQERELQDYQLAGEHVIAGEKGIRVEWGASVVNFTQEDPDFRQFSNTFSIGDEGDTTYFISPAEFDLPFNFFRNLKDQQYSGKLDITVPIAQGRSKANKIRFGGFLSDKDREFSDRVFQIQIPNGAARYAGDPDAFFGPENSGIIDFDAERERYTIGLYPLPFEKPTRENSYNGTETVAAGYAMIEYDWDKFKVIAGARAEYTDIMVASLAEGLDTAEINQVDVLPSLNLIYRLNEKMNLRASASQTLARPNMRELAPFVAFDYGGGNRVQGNPNLKRTLIQNYDLRWEWFPSAGEIIAASAYYKNFNDPIVTAFVPESANPLIRYTNVDQATVYGLELEFRRKLDFIASFLQDFKFITNFSLIESVVDIPEAELEIIQEFNPEKGDTRQFLGQSPFLVNASLNYLNDVLGLDAIVSLNVFGRRLAVISEGKNPDVFEEARPLLDFSVSKTLTNRWRLKLSARNLLNPNYEQTMTFRDKTYILRQYQTGRNFGLSLSYKI